MLHARNLTVRRNGAACLNDVDVSVVGGEMVALVGAAGSGKTTLISALAGDLPAARGDVWLAGRPLHTWSARALAERRAYLSATLTGADIDSFSARDIVALGRTPHVSLSQGKHDKAITDAALRWVRAEHLADRPYGELSGQAQRMVQLGRLLAQIWGRPARGDCYVLLDEPTQGLDILHAQRVMAILRQLAGEGAAVILACHDLNLAAHFCDRLVLLRQGSVHREGDPAAVLTPGTIRRAFGIDVDVTSHASSGRPCIVPAPT